MSRDHYKGVPKKVDARIDHNGKIFGLSKVSTRETISADFLATKRDDTIERRFIYARSTGDDANGDGSLENPFRTYRRARKEVPSISHNIYWHVDISGIGTETYTDVFHEPVFSSNLKYRLSVDLPVSPNQNFYEFPLNVVAEPTELQTFTPTSTISRTKSTMKTFVLTGAGWTTNEFKGKWVFSGLAEYGVVISNTSDTLVTTMSAASGDITISEPSATLVYGKESDPFFDGAIGLSGVQSSFGWFGVRVEKNDTSLQAVPDVVGSLWHPARFVMCDFSHVFMQFGGGYINVDACYFRDGYSLNGMGTSVTNSYFESTQHNNHNDGGQGMGYAYCRFDNPSDVLGHGANTQASIAFNYDNCEIENAPADAIVYHGGPTSSIIDTVINGTAGDAIQADGPGKLLVQGVIGVNNSGYGLNITNGSQILVNSSTTVSGSTAHVKVGVLPGETWTSFRSGTKSRVDVTAVSGTLARLHQ